MSKQPFDDFLKQQLAQPTQQPEPQKALWRGVEQAIQIDSLKQHETPSAKDSLHHGLGLTACLAAGAFAWFVSFQQPDQTPLIEISALFEQEKQSLMIQYASYEAAANNWQSQLAQLEEAETAIKLALKENPENGALLSMLSQIYQQQLDLINRVHNPSRQYI